MVYVYCPRQSEGSRQLVKAVRGHRLRRFDGVNFFDASRRVPLRPDSVVVVWGSTLHSIEGHRVLNGAHVGNKLEQGIALMKAKVPCVWVSETEPVLFRMSEGLAAREYLKRTRWHQEGHDLLNPPARADFWVRKEVFVREFRLHSFNGKCIRAGEKVIREGFPNPSPWIRSFDAGWRIKYDEFETNKKMRKVAHAAVAALGLTFGAVDIGELADGSYLCIEVNKAPGIEGHSVDTYARKIQAWVETPATTDPDPEGRVQPRGTRVVARPDFPIEIEEEPVYDDDDDSDQDDSDDDE